MVTAVRPVAALAVEVAAVVKAPVTEPVNVPVPPTTMP